MNDDGPCFYCNEITDSFAGNPGRWPLVFAHPDGTGIVKHHHVKCVVDRLNLPTEEQVREAVHRGDEAYPDETMYQPHGKQEYLECIVNEVMRLFS